MPIDLSTICEADDVFRSAGIIWLIRVISNGPILGAGQVEIRAVFSSVIVC